MASLHDEVFVTVLPRAFRKPVNRKRNGFVNGQVGCFPAFGRAGPFAAPPLLVGGIGM